MLNYYKDKHKLNEDDIQNSRNAYKYSITLPIHNNIKKDNYLHVIRLRRSMK